MMLLAGPKTRLCYFASAEVENLATGMDSSTKILKRLTVTAPPVPQTSVAVPKTFV